MGEIAKKGSLNTLILYAGTVLGAVNTILLYPKLLPEEEFGMVTLLVSISLLISGIGQFGSSSSIVKFLPFYQQKENNSTQGLLLYLVGISLAVSIIIIILLLVFKGFFVSQYKNSAALIVEYYWAIFPLFICILFNGFFSAYCIALHKPTFPAILNEVYLRVGQTGLIVLYFFNVIYFQGFIVGYISLYLSFLIYILIYLNRIGEFRFFEKIRLTVNEALEVFRYGVYTLLSSIASSLSYKIDVLMIGAMIVSDLNANAGLRATAIYTVALNMASMIEMPFRAMGSIISPKISEYWKSNEQDKINEIYVKTTEVMSVLGAYVYFGIWMCIDNIINVLPESYSEVKYVFFWLGLGKFFNIISGVNGQILINSVYYKIFTVFTIISLFVTYGTNYVFITKWQVDGAALATAITYFLFNISICVFLFRKYRFQPFTKMNIIPIVLAGCLSLGFYNLFSFNDVVTIGLKFTGFSLIFWFIIIRFRVSTEITGFWDKVVVSRFWV